MLETTWMFIGGAAFLLTAASVTLAVTLEDSVIDAFTDPDADEAPKWSLVTTPFASVAWAMFTIGSLNKEIVTMCCTYTRSEIPAAILGVLFFLLTAGLFINEAVALYAIESK